MSHCDVLAVGGAAQLPFFDEVIQHSLTRARRDAEEPSCLVQPQG
jgi:hypothetical protein